jgi:glycosyltransferase involved in cell wall biosynthesis
MNILSLSTCPLDPTLGSGKTRLRWSEGLRALGHSVEMVEPKEFEVWHGQSRALRFRQAWGACRFIRERLAATAYDLVEFFGGEFGLATWLLSRRPEHPLIVAHTDGLELLAAERERIYNPPTSSKQQIRAWFATQTHDRLSRTAFVHADAFVTGCELDREYVLKLGLYPKHRTGVVEPGLDPEYLAVSFTLEKEERIAYTGSWGARKGVGLLCRVMSHVLTQRPTLKFDVFGTGGQQRDVLKCFPSELHERIVVHAKLTTQELAARLAKAKVFFFPTQYEGFGMALAEAMACSCVPVTTRTGFGATLRDGEEALLTEFDDTDAMARAILSLLDDEGRRRQVARGAWQRVRPLIWDANIAKLAALYQAWIGEHQQLLARRQGRPMDTTSATDEAIRFADAETNYQR